MRVVGVEVIKRKWHRGSWMISNSIIERVSYLSDNSPVETSGTCTEDELARLVRQVDPSSIRGSGAARRGNHVTGSFLRASRFYSFYASHSVG